MFFNIIICLSFIWSMFLIYIICVKIDYYIEGLEPPSIWSIIGQIVKTII